MTKSAMAVKVDTARDEQSAVPRKRTYALDDNDAFGKHSAANGDPETLARIAAQIDKHGVEYIYYQIPTLGGKLVAKIVPAAHFRRTFLKGILQHRTAMCDLQTSRDGVLLGGGIDAREFNALPDPETFAVLPWAPHVARVFCEAYEPPHLKGVGGRPLALDCRSTMRRIHAAFTAEFGAVIKSGCEPEMTWSGEGLDVKKKAGSSPAYQVTCLEMMRPVYEKVYRYCTALGFDMIQGDYEDDGQLELNWEFDDIDLTTDRLLTYRQVCIQVARELGINASFMPKPRVGIMGNGCHHNLSAWRDGVNLLETEGRKDLHVSTIGKNMIAGLMAHTPALTMIMASTVNSYKRFWDVGQFAPDQVSWGLDNRGAMIRISSIGRMEYRLPDSAVNPYLSHSLITCALADGLRRELDPGKPIELREPEERNNTLEVPRTLGDAVDMFAQNDFVKESLPETMVNALINMKRDEWARYCGAVTDWERDNYWETLV